MGSSTAILCCNRGRRPRQFALFGELELIARLRARAVERLANVVSGPRKTARNSASVRRRVHHMRGPSHLLGMTEGKVPSPLVPKLRFGTKGAPVNPVQQEISAFFASSAVNRTEIDDLGYGTLLSRASKRSG